MRRKLFAALVCSAVALTVAYLLLGRPAPPRLPGPRTGPRGPEPLDGARPEPDFEREAEAEPEPEEEEVETIRLDDYRDRSRVLILFVAQADDDYREQKQALDAHRDGLKERDLVQVEVLEQGRSRVEGRFLARAEATAIRRRFQVEEGSYALILLGKDGTEKARWYTAIPASAVFEVVDSMPMRRREMRERAGT